MHWGWRRKHSRQEKMQTARDLRGLVARLSESPRHNATKPLRAEHLLISQALPLENVSLYICAFAKVHHMWVRACGGQKRTLDPSELEL